LIKFIISHFLLFCLLLISSVFYYFTLTHAGLQTDVQIVTRALAGKLRIESAQGALFSDFSLQNISYQEGADVIQIQSVHLSWNPLGLFAHKLIINNIAVNQAKIVIPTIPATRSSTSSISSTQTNHPFWNFFKDIRVKQAQLNHVNIRFIDSEINISGGFQKNWDLQWDATIPKLATLLAGSNGSVTTIGKVNGPFLTPNIQANLQGKNLAYANQHINQLNAEIHLIIQPHIQSSLTLSASGVKLDNYPLKKFDLTIQGDVNYANKALTTRLTSLIDKRYSIAAHLTFPQFAGIQLNQPIAGNISSTLSQLDLLTKYIPQIKEPRGTLQATVLLKGTLAKPEITAALNLTNGKIHIPSLGITPQDIYLQGTTNVNKQLNFSGHFRSGKGHATLQGSVDFNNPDYPLALEINGTELQAVKLPEYSIIISPTIHLTFVKQNLKLQGTILIPEAQITPASFDQSITLSNDVVFVGAKDANNLPFTTNLQLTLKLGEDIHLASHNLSATLAGNVQLNQLPGAVINAVGELYTKQGVYTAYGKTLKIQTGRLIYTGGSLMNPGLNISATKKLKTINTGGNMSSFTGQTSLRPIYTGTEKLIVGVEVTGTLDNPVFSLISTPSLPQGDILSYLVFGYPASQANGNEYGALLSALSSMNPNTPSMGNFTKNLEQKLGLSEMTVQSVQVFNPNATSTSHSVVSTTSFVVGKKLSDDISIHYSIGLFNPVSILNLRYQLSKNWAVQSETSTFDNGADILYSIERD